MLFVYRRNDIKEVKRRCSSKILLFGSIKELCITLDNEEEGLCTCHSFTEERTEEKAREDRFQRLSLLHKIKELCNALDQGNGGSDLQGIRQQNDGLKINQKKTSFKDSPV